MSYTLDFNINLGSGYTGKTLNAQLYDTNGNVGSPITTGFSERGTGIYLLHCTTVPDGHRGGIEFYEAGTPAVKLASTSINPEESGQVELKATGLDNISVADPGGVAGHTSIAKMLVALWRYFFKKTSVDATELKTYEDDGIAVNDTMTVSDDGTTQVKGAAS